MDILQSILYGIVSGLAEFLPISSTGHQGMLKVFFGVEAMPLLDIFVHSGLLLAVIISSATYIERLKRQLRITGNKKRPINADRILGYEIRLIRSAMIPMLLAMVVFSIIGGGNFGLLGLAVLFAINGVIIYFPEHLPQGNKDAMLMSKADGILIGVFGALSVFPGISRIGASSSYAVARGADKTKVVNWMLALSIPALLLSIVLDIVALFVYGVGSFSVSILFGYILSAAFAFGAGIFGISIIRMITARSSFSSLGYYSWGAALLAFILYLSA